MKAKKLGHLQSFFVLSRQPARAFSALKSNAPVKWPAGLRMTGNEPACFTYYPVLILAWQYKTDSSAWAKAFQKSWHRTHSTAEEHRTREDVYFCHSCIFVIHKKYLYLGKVLDHLQLSYLPESGIPHLLCQSSGNFLSSLALQVN